MSLTVAPNVDFTSAASQAAFKTALNTLLNELRTNGAALSDIRGMKNRFINAAMRVDRRNKAASQTITAGAALAYTVDRWYAYCTGANVTGQQVTVSGQKRYRFTGAASVTGVGFAQRIEAANSADLASTTATLQVKLSSSSLTSIGWAAYYANTTDTFGTLASPTRTSIASGTFTINSTEATYSAQISVPSGAITGIEIVFTGGALLGTQTLTIGDAQLEAGASLTPFERIPYAADLAACLWYFEIYRAASAELPASTGWAYNATSANVMIPIAPKRAGSTISYTGTLAVSSAAGGVINITGIVGGYGFLTESGGVSLQVTVASGLTAGAGLSLYANGTACTIIFNAEL